jgi:hypothetical protein
VVADAELAASGSHSAEPLAPAEWEAVAAVEERAHSGHDAASRPSKKTTYMLNTISPSSRFNRGEKSQTQNDRLQLQQKDLKRHKFLLPNLKLITTSIKRVSKRVYHGYIICPKKTQLYLA